MNRSKGCHPWSCGGSLTAALKRTESFRVSFVPPLRRSAPLYFRVCQDSAVHLWRGCLAQPAAVSPEVAPDDW